METRVAVLAIIVKESASVAALNDFLHQYGDFIIGRMGIPYRQRGVNVISVAMDAPAGHHGQDRVRPGGRAEVMKGRKPR